MDIHVAADVGAACIHNDIAYARIREETSTGIPEANIIGGFEDYQFNYDDLGVFEGTHHREWSACEMAIARLSENYLAFGNQQWDNPAQWTAPSDGVMRLWNSTGWLSISYKINDVGNLPSNGPGGGQANSIAVQLLKDDVITMVMQEQWNTNSTGYLIFLPKNY